MALLIFNAGSSSLKFSFIDPVDERVWTQGSASPAQTVRDIVDEVLREGPVEVGVMARTRLTLELVASPIISAGQLQFGAGEVLVVTGGARGVTAEATVEQARSGATVALFGRCPPPTPDRDDAP